MHWHHSDTVGEQRAAQHLLVNVQPTTSETRLPLVNVSVTRSSETFTHKDLERAAQCAVQHSADMESNRY